jgi:hypothetical protein
MVSKCNLCEPLASCWKMARDTQESDDLRRLAARGRGWLAGIRIHDPNTGEHYVCCYLLLIDRG